MTGAKANRIDPKTGKRYGFVPPEKRGREREEEARALQEHLKVVERVQRGEAARTDLLKYVQLINPDPEAPNDVARSRYEAAKVHIEVAKALEQVERGEIVQLIFCMPPRHGKTQLATKSFAAWYSGKHPDHDIAVASYSDTMAQDFGADTRAIIHSSQHKQAFSAHKLRRGGNAKDNIQTDRGGRLVFVGRGGALTGRGAHLLLIDDLFKDHEEARSQAIRDQAWNWFTKVAMTRRMGKRLVVVTMTRWHSDDIIGRLTDPENPHYNAVEAAKWKIIRLPAIAEGDDPLGRAPGEPLWPERYDLEFLESQQRLDPLGFAALYQQRPTVADGALFRRENFRFYEDSELPDNLRYYCASDHAVSTGQRHDWTVLLKVGLDTNGNIYVLDCWWQKQPTTAVVEAMLVMAQTKPPLIWWAEKGHISKSIGPFLYRRMQDTGTYINVREVSPIGGSRSSESTAKEQRAQSMAGMVGLGRVFFPKNRIWTERAINELLAFPNGTHDDFVDALAYIGLGLRAQIPASAPTKERKEPAFGTLGWLKWNDKWQHRRNAGRQWGH